jgi:hypothetical protein
MMKIVLCSRRHPAMSRPQFYRHLLHHHAPLVRSVTAFERYVRKYVQNHARLPEDGVEVATAYPHALERDSVIELWFRDQQRLQEALAEPAYLARIRPDEAFFNDLDKLIVLATAEQPVWNPDVPRGRFKVFDFIRRRTDCPPEEFARRWQEHTALLTESAVWRATVGKAVWNASVAQADNPFGTPAAFDGVLETWFEHVDDVDRLAAARREGVALQSDAAAFIDMDASFSVVAEEFQIIDRSRS